MLVEVHETALDPVDVGCGLVVPPLVRIDVAAVRAVRDDAGRRDLDVVDGHGDRAARLRARDRDRSHDRPLVRFGRRIGLRVEVLRRTEVARVAFDRLDREHLAGLHGSDRRVLGAVGVLRVALGKALHRREREYIRAPMQTLADQVAVVTGAARGIGRGIASVLSAEGARVVVVDLDEALATETAAELGGDGDRRRRHRPRFGGGDGRPRDRGARARSTSSPRTPVSTPSPT